MSVHQLRGQDGAEALDNTYGSIEEKLENIKNIPKYRVSENRVLVFLRTEIRTVFLFFRNPRTRTIFPKVRIPDFYWKNIIRHKNIRVFESLLFHNNNMIEFHKKHFRNILILSLITSIFSFFCRVILIMVLRRDEWAILNRHLFLNLSTKSDLINKKEIDDLQPTSWISHIQNFKIEKESSENRMPLCPSRKVSRYLKRFM